MEQLSQRQRVTEYIRDRYAAEAEHLWAKYPNYAVFRQPASRKWFALVMDVPRNRLGFEGGGDVDIMDVKCGALMVGSLLAQDGFLPAYHMSKSSWISIVLDDCVPDERVELLLAMSYDSVEPKRKGKERADA